MSYADFLEHKRNVGADTGFEPVYESPHAFDFQNHLIDWSVRKGRAAIFADCGMGKTLIELAWAQNVVQKTNRPVLLLTPLAVAPQTVAEAEKFEIDATRGTDGDRVHVANYEQLHHYDSADYAGVVCDESSILKSFDGARRSQITQFMRKVPYRLLATATAAPNDYIELGTSSEALGNLGHMDMLNRFFRNQQGNSATGRQYGEMTKWRLKGHAETPFWRWVCSWARAARMPSDLGFDDGDFILPPLKESAHMVEARSLANGMLFDLPAVGLDEQRAETRRTIQERCERIAAIVDTDQPALVWCHLNDEGDLLADMIPGAVQVAGKHTDAQKEERLTGFARGEFRVLVTKPKIGAWGLNYQHCAHVAGFPSHSFEQYYQGVRRCWRFGQKRPVQVDMVMTEGVRSVMDNLKRKQSQAAEMFLHLVEEMNHAISISTNYETTREVMPSWL